MTSTYRLAERAVLMRLTAVLPGKSRKDRNLTENVKTEHGLGRASGAWIKQRWPDWALAPLEKLVNEARTYHLAVTLPFDAGIGILPAALIMEYSDRMRDFRSRFDNLRDSHFKVKYPEMIEWAKAEHNGTFDASDYPEVEELMASFYFATEPLPVADAMQEAQRELMRRLIDPVKAMAVKLAEQPKEGKASPVFRDTLIENIKTIAGLAPKLNIAGDPQIDVFVSEITKLTRFEPDTLRKSVQTREDVRREAEATLAKLTAYKL